MEVRADGVDGQVECEGDVLVAALLLMIKDEDGAFGLGELEEGLVYGFEDLGVGELLLGVGSVVGESLDEGWVFVVFVGVEGWGEEVGTLARRRFHSSWATLTMMR